MTYVNQLDLPNSPSLTISTPSSACLRTTSPTALRSVAVRVASSVSSVRARTEGGRIMLPACVVRMRSVLRFIQAPRLQRGSRAQRIGKSAGDGPRRQLDASFEPQLGENVRDVRFGRALANDQCCGNATVAGALCDQTCDLLLARGQRHVAPP